MVTRKSTRTIDPEGNPDGLSIVIDGGEFKIGSPTSTVDTAAIRDAIAAAILPGSGVTVEIDTEGRLTISAPDSGYDLVPLTTEVAGVPDLVWDADNQLVLTQLPVPGTGGGVSGPDGGDAASGASYDLVTSAAPEFYWRFGELTGTTINDYMANGHDATLSGSYTLGIPGAVDGGRAILANPVARDLRVRAPHSTAFDTSAFSILGWIKITNPSLIRQTILDTTGNPTIGDDPIGWTLSVVSYNSLSFDLFRSDISGFLSWNAGAPGIDDHDWHAVAFTSNGSDHIRFWMDGILLADRGETAGTFATETTTNPMQAGFTGSFAQTGNPDEDGYQHFLGGVDDLAWFDSVLPDATIIAHATAGR